MSCQSCEMISINGMACHETGCPDAWRDRPRVCRECGFDFRPTERVQMYCSPCCAAAAYGMQCECPECERGGVT